MINRGIKFLARNALLLMHYLSFPRRRQYSSRLELSMIYSFFSTHSTFTFLLISWTFLSINGLSCLVISVEVAICVSGLSLFIIVISLSTSIVLIPLVKSSAPTWLIYKSGFLLVTGLT